MGGMDLGLTGARALVGGGSRGLGGAIAEALAAEGARVAVVSRPGAGLEAQAARLGGLAVGADLVDARRTRRRRSTRRSTPGRPGPARRQHRRSARPAASRTWTKPTWLRAIDGTLLAPCASSGPRSPTSARAAIRPSSSSCRAPSASRSRPCRRPTSSGPGLAGLLKSLVEEIAPIRINGLAPGRVATDRIGQLDTARADDGRRRRRGDPATDACERIPLGRYGDPAELGRVGAFLLSPAASYVTGAIVPVDGGMIKALP